MCEGNNMELILIGVTAFATFLAAISAWFSYQVSKDSLKFQKVVAKNQSKTMQYNNVLIKLCSLSRLQKNPLASSDKKFESMDGLLTEVQKQLEELSNISELDLESLDINKCTSAAMLNGIVLDQAIQEVETQLSNLWR